jgi:hypothetical protein
MMTSLRAAALCALFASAPAVARAQTPPAPPPPPPAQPPAPNAMEGPDQVDLRNGGMVRGTLVEMEPGKDIVIIVQGTGEVRRIPWGMMTNITRGHGNREAPRAPSAGAAPPPPPSAPQPGAPFVHVDNEGELPVVLHQVTSRVAMVGPGGTAFGVVAKPICRAPCDQIVDAREGQIFFFAGEGVVSSPQFTLSPRLGPRVHMAVRPGGTGRRAGGIVMASLGGAALLGGITMIALGATATSVTDAGASSAPSKGTMIAGGITAGLGLGLLIGGIAVIVQGSTRVTFVQPEAPAAPRVGLGANGIAVRF